MSRIWASPTWYFFHTFAEKINPVFYKYNAANCFNIINDQLFSGHALLPRTLETTGTPEQLEQPNQPEQPNQSEQPNQPKVRKPGRTERQTPKNK